MVGAFSIALAVCAGCGSSGGAEPLTKAQFTNQANQICAKAGKEIVKKLSTFVEDQPNEGAGQSRDELFAGAMKTVVLPLTEAKANQIEALAAPVGDEKKIEAYLASLHAGISAIKKQESTSFAALHDSLVGFEQALAPSRKLAVAYGMQEC
jgi:Na+-translocating ferredoxin:NAD+ oxidoreductase RNF subunit RnfB